MTPLQQQILDVLCTDTLTAQETADRIRDRTVSGQLIRMNDITVALSGLVRAGALEADWRWPETDHRPRTRVYRKAEQP